MSRGDIVDRRRHLRVRVAATALVWADGASPVRYLVEDLSSGGCLLTGGPLLPVGAATRVTLSIASEEPLVVGAVVVRHRSGPMPALAVAFAGLDDASQDAIHQAVLAALEAERRGECPSRHVLIVDESEASCSALSGALTGMGHRVVSATSPPDATLRIEDPYVHFDVAFVDLFVAGHDGTELLERVAKFHPGIHRVLMSGRVVRDQLQLAQRSGRADAVLSKPWDRSSLLSAIRA